MDDIGITTHVSTDLYSAVCSKAVIRVVAVHKINIKSSQS